MKKLTLGKIWCFAIGQLGWSTLSALLSSWLVNFYQPDNAALQAGQPVFIPQGRAVLGVITVLGAITAFGRVFDAVSDPLIAAASDRCRSRAGRRIPFMRAAAIPFAAATVLVFWSPIRGVSWINALVLLLTLTLFYFFMTAYCTPYTALIPELGRDQKTRLSISTTISLTYIVGTAVAYLGPVIWDALPLERVTAIRVTFTGMALFSTACMFVPVFTIREKDYVQVTPAQDSAFRSLAATFRNKDFRAFVASDVMYFLGLTMYQTALPYFVTSLLGLDERMSTVYYVIMTALSLVFYLPVNRLTGRWGKKKLILVAFGIFTVNFGYAALLGDRLPLPPTLQGYGLCILGAPALAIFGILPQAVVADISEYDALETGQNRSGMFYAARTFAFKMGQSVAMLLVTAIATVRPDIGLGYRLVALAAAIVCLSGGLLFLLYNERKVYGKIQR